MGDVMTAERPKQKVRADGAPGFTIERDVLLDAIRTVGQVVETRNTIPILSNILLIAEGDRLELVATDLDILAEISVPCTAVGRVEVTVPADRLRSAVDTLQPGTISLVVKDGSVTLSRGGATRKLLTLPADDFPRMKWEDGATCFEMNADTLRGMFEAVQAAISTEEVRYYLNGVYLHATGDDSLTAAATDGHRLHRAVVKRPAGADGMAGVIIGRKTVRLLIRELGEAEDGAAVEVRLGDRMAAFRVGKLRIVAKLIDATYPDYQRTIPSQNKDLLLVQSAELARCVAAVASMISTKTRGIRLELRKAGSHAIVQSPDTGTAIEPIAAEFGADELIIGANARYVAQICAMFGEAAQLEVAFADPRAPILFTCPDKPGLSAVLMPMNA